jgi:hypothetical protein
MDCSTPLYSLAFDGSTESNITQLPKKVLGVIVECFQRPLALINKRKKQAATKYFMLVGEPGNSLPSLTVLSYGQLMLWLLLGTTT